MSSSAQGVGRQLPAPRRGEISDPDGPDDRREPSLRVDQGVGGMDLIPDREHLEERYLGIRQPYRQILDALSEEIQDHLEKEALHVTVRSRLKSFAGYYRKLIGKKLEGRKRQAASRRGLGRMAQESRRGGDLDTAVNDLLGIRIICPFLGDLKVVEKVLRRLLTVLQIERKGENQSYREFGYDSTHFLIQVPERICKAAGIEVQPVCEVQVRTTLQEAWAEIEHELVYKAELSPLDEPLRRKLASLKATLTLSDNIFQEIRDYQRQMQEQLRYRKDELWVRVLDLAGRKLPASEGKPAEADVARTSQNGAPNQAGPPAGRNGPNAPPGRETESVEDIDVMLLRALAAHNRQELGEALRLYSRILAHELVPRARVIVLLHRGTAFFLRGEPASAQEDFSEALGLDRENPRAWYLRGVARWALERTSDALADLGASLELNPVQPDVLVCRALLRCQVGDSAGALADSERVLAVAPDSSEAQDLQDMLTVEATHQKACAHPIKRAAGGQPDRPPVVAKGINPGQESAEAVKLLP